MTDDEREVRQLIQTWMQATRDGDAETVLSLVTDDVVFLLPGREPMTHTEFEAQTRAQSGTRGLRIDGHSEIEELVVVGDVAYLRNRLSIEVTPGNGATMRRAGYTLTVFRKQDGRWRLARDANLLTAAPAG